MTRQQGTLACLPSLYPLLFASSSISPNCAFELACGSQAKSGWGALQCWSLEAAGQGQEHGKGGARRQWVCRLWSLSSSKPPWLVLLRETDKGFTGICLHAHVSALHGSTTFLKAACDQPRGQKWSTLKMPLCSSQPAIQISIWKVVGPSTKSVSSVYLMISHRYLATGRRNVSALTLAVCPALFREATPQQANLQSPTECNIDTRPARRPWGCVCLCWKKILIKQPFRENTVSSLLNCTLKQKCYF